MKKLITIKIENFFEGDPDLNKEEQIFSKTLEDFRECANSFNKELYEEDLEKFNKMNDEQIIKLINDKSDLFVNLVKIEMKGLLSLKKTNDLDFKLAA